jgi:hypothetical protein
MNDLFLFLFFVSFVCLVIGLIKPSIFSRFIKGEITRKRVGLIFGIATILLFILFGATIDTSKNNKAIQPPTLENSETTINNEKQTITNNEDESLQTKTSESTQTKQVADKNVSLIPTETTSQKNAVKKAKSYLNYSAFSHDGLVNQLEYDQFSHTDAIYGADNSGANWNEQAAKKAKQYMNYSAFSRGGLITQLKFEKFTQEQAEYGASAVGL